MEMFSISETSCLIKARDKYVVHPIPENSQRFTTVTFLTDILLKFSPKSENIENLNYSYIYSR